MSEAKGKKRPPEEPLVFEGTMAFHPEGRPDGEITIAKVTFRGRAFASSGASGAAAAPLHDGLSLTRDALVRKGEGPAFHPISLISVADGLLQAPVVVWKREAHPVPASIATQGRPDLWVAPAWAKQSCPYDARLFLLFTMNDAYDLRSALRDMPPLARPSLPPALLHFFPSIDVMRQTLVNAPTREQRPEFASVLSSERDSWRLNFGSVRGLDTGGQAIGEDDAELGLIQDLLTACCTPASAAQAKGVADVVAGWLGRGIDQELTCGHCGHKLVFNLAAHPQSTTPSGITVIFDRPDEHNTTLTELIAAAFETRAMFMPDSQYDDYLSIFKREHAHQRPDCQHPWSIEDRRLHRSTSPFISINVEFDPSKSNLKTARKRQIKELQVGGATYELYAVVYQYMWSNGKVQAAHYIAEARWRGQALVRCDGMAGIGNEVNLMKPDTRWLIWEGMDRDKCCNIAMLVYARK